MSEEEIEYLNQCKRYLKQFYKITDNGEYFKILDKLLQEYKKQKIQSQQLESDKQKLIEKLEEDIKVFSNYEERKQMCKEQLFENDGKWFYAKEILNIVKGENDE